MAQRRGDQQIREDLLNRACEGLVNASVKAVYFDAPVVLEGKLSKGDGRNRRVCVPRRHRDAIKAPCWVWMRVDAGQPFFAHARRSPSRESIDITLPSFAVPKFPSGKIVHVVVEPAETFAPLPTAEDWLPHIDREHYHVSPVGEDIALWSGHEPPFVMGRAPTDEYLHWWLLGFYQAEGSKKNPVDFNVASTNPDLLRDMIDALGTWGIKRTRLRLTLRHRLGTTDATVRTLFEPLGLPTTAVRATEKNDDIATLFVNASLPLVRTVCAKLDDIFMHGFPSVTAAQAYALGWLDGDGSIGLTTSLELRLAGTEQEHIVLLKALEHAFRWKILKGSFGSLRSHTSRALSLGQAAELAAVGAFNHSMNRARLVHTLALRLARYAGKGRSHTDAGDFARASALFDAHLTKEAAVLAQHPLAATSFVTGEKCAPYPNEKSRLDHRPRRPFR
jgi:hypothetical protein